MGKPGNYSMSDQAVSGATGLMAGKRGLIMGVANDRSIAWGIARCLGREGAELAFTYQNETFLKRVAPLAEQVGSTIVLPCDVADKQSVDDVFAALGEAWGSFDFVVHAIAYSDKEELKGQYLNTTPENFKQTMDISCFSFTAVVKRAAPMINHGGSVLTLTYAGAERVMPQYNVMGVAKAALEASVRYLAADLGRDGIRVNALSAGPMRTLAGSGISSARYIYKWSQDNAPLRRSVELDEVGNSAVYLLSGLSGAVTGETHHVDCGYNIVGMKAIDGKPTQFDDATASPVEAAPPAEAAPAVEADPPADGSPTKETGVAALRTVIEADLPRIATALDGAMQQARESGEHAIERIAKALERTVAQARESGEAMIERINEVVTEPVTPATINVAKKKGSYTYDELLECAHGDLFGPGNARLPLPPMLMFDRIARITEDGGSHGKGDIVAELDVRPDLWFFECHFESDPVMPGCLGLDALWQLLGFYLGWRGSPGRGRALGVGEVKLTGQVLPTATTIRYHVDLKRVIQRKLVLGIADAMMEVDGRPIYEARDLRVGLFAAADDAKGETT